MTRQDIVMEKERLSYMIVKNIQGKHDLNHLTRLLARQTWLSSESKKERQDVLMYAKTDLS